MHRKKKKDIHKERLRLYNLCKKHNIHYISCLSDIDFDVKQIISIRPLLDSTCFFILSKKNKNKKKNLHFLVINYVMTAMECCFEKTFYISSELLRMQEFCTF